MWQKSLPYSLYLAGALALVASAAAAQSDEERAGARALAQQGAEAFEQGQWQEAVDLFGRAESVVHALPHLLYIARSQEKLGRLVEAQEAYIKITRESLSTDAPRAFRDAKVEAERELAALEPRVPSVTVVVSGEGATEAEVRIDDVAIPRAFVGAKRPTDPGKHVYSATAPGAEAASVSLVLAEGASETVRMELVPAAASAVPLPSTSSAVAPPSSPLPQLDSGETGPRYRIPMYASFGVGAVGLIGGTVFVIRRSSAQSDADSHWNDCADRGDCDQGDANAIASRDDDAAQAGTLALVGYGLGIAGVGAGVAFWLLDRSAEDPDATAQSGVHVSPWIGVGNIGMSGSF